MEEVYYEGEGPHWAVVTMKKKIGTPMLPLWLFFNGQNTHGPYAY